MTKRITISLPDDLAATLDTLPAGQVSGFVAEALRRRRISDDARSALTAAGHRDFPFDPIGAQQRLSAGRIDARTREAALGRVADLTGMDPDAVTENVSRNAASSGW